MKLNEFKGSKVFSSSDLQNTNISFKSYKYNICKNNKDIVIDKSKIKKCLFISFHINVFKNKNEIPFLIEKLNLNTSLKKNKLI